MDSNARTIIAGKLLLLLDCLGVRFVGAVCDVAGHARKFLSTENLRGEALKVRILAGERVQQGAAQALGMLSLSLLG